MKEQSEPKHDVFISYSHADKDWVRGELLPRLEEAGLKVIIDYRDFEIGVPSLVNMERAVEDSRHTLIVLTPAWIESQWTEFESLLVSTADPAGRRRKLIPLMLTPCDLPPRIAMLTYADFTKPSERESEIVRLVRSVSTRRPEEPSVQITTRKPLEAVTNNLPIQLTSFIGREREMAQVKGLLSRARLVTLTGPGGCGKTRLALEVAKGLVEDYADGVWLVELAALEDEDLVPQVMASVLGVREEPGRPLTDTLLSYLRSKELLMLLDNCEHVVEACAGLADTLVCACPELRLLVTSREVLNVRGEVIWRVPPLSLPAPEALPSVERLEGSEAVRLFVERACVSRPAFALTGDNAVPVAQICQRLDGIPLAIELAAVRVKLLPVEQIAARLDDCFRLLTRGWRGPLPHHQTLRAAVDWSYDLLNEGERLLFNRLSAFAGGFTLPAAEAVGAGDGVVAYDVLDLVSGLVDKSLVLVEEGADRSVRYRLLEMLRQYGRERLWELEETEAVRSRHAAYFLALAEEAEPQLTGPDQAAWLDRLETEHDNLRTALHWATESGDAETGLRLGGVLWRFWYVRGYYSEGRERLAGLLALSGALGHTRALAKALNGAGVLAWAQGDHTAACSLHEESLAICRELGDRQGIAKSLNNLGVVSYEQGDYSRARSLYEESLAILRELGDKGSISVLLNNLGEVSHDQGDYAAAQSVYEESLAIKRELGDQWGIAVSLNNLGEVAYHQGDYGAARSFHEGSLAIKRELGDKQGIADSLNNLGDVAREQGDYGAARSRYEASLAIWQELGTRRKIALSLTNLGTVAYCQGDYATARSLHEESLAIRRGLGDRQGIAESFSNLGDVARDQGDYATARSLYEESLAIWQELGTKQNIALSLHNLGIVAYYQGDYAAARSPFEKSLAIRRDLGDKPGIADSLNALGNLTYELGDYATARSLYEESLEVFRGLGRKRGVAVSLRNLGLVAHQQGDSAAARSLYDESLSMYRELGDKWGIAASLNSLGELAYAQGGYAAARSLHKESLKIFRELGNKEGIAGSLESFVGLAVVQAQPERALCLAGAAAALRETIGAPLSPAEKARLDRHVEMARQALGEEAAAKALANGGAMTTEEAIEYALGESPQLSQAA